MPFLQKTQHNTCPLEKTKEQKPLTAPLRSAENNPHKTTHQKQTLNETKRATIKVTFSSLNPNLRC
jgi:hypothetical protein